MIKAVIFDVDGVLIDNTKVYIKAYKETGKRLGLKIPPDEEIEKCFGLIWEDILIRLYGPDENIKKTYLGFCKKLEHEIKIMDDAEYVLKRIKLRKAIAASKSVSTLEKKLGNLTRFFEVIVARDDTEKHKPDPEPILLACKKLGIKPEEAVYVGDAMFDFQAAKSAGTGFIGFISGSASEKDFKALKTKSVTSFKSLLKEFQ